MLTRVAAHKVPSRIKLLASFAINRVDYFTDECNFEIGPRETCTTGVG